jgi:beta-galactosidase
MIAGDRFSAGSARVALAVAFLLSCLWPPAQAAERREVIQLDGVWEVDESVEGDTPPTAFNHRVSVPGLTHSAVPPFVDVDQFDSREAIASRFLSGQLPESALVGTAGVSRQSRNYFWYRIAFKAPARRSVATLVVNKAQFGAEVWVNGKKAGEHVGCSTSASYDVTAFMRWMSSNEIVIRIGAHPGVLPDGNPCGVDFEKKAWTPGIWDSVSVTLSDVLKVEAVQIAPKIRPRAIVVQADLRNFDSVAREAVVDFIVYSENPKAMASTRANKILGKATHKVRVAPGSTKKITRQLLLPQAKLWSPEQPHLYYLKVSTPRDSVVTRFGVREFRFDTATMRAYLNGAPYFLRGANITLHRFFEDPLSRELPWNDSWVRKLLGENVRAMHWNAMRFCIGAVPQRWLEIADEEGLLVQYEFPIWTSSPRKLPKSVPIKQFDAGQLIVEFAGWMRDSWNHPSVVLWDASNETEMPMLGERVMPAVRGLDLSARNWENGYNPPAGPDDPVEDHVYEFLPNVYPGPVPPFDMIDLERGEPRRRTVITPPTGHSLLLNEYGWLWLHRDGTSTVATKNLYPKLPFPHATPAERLETQAYLLAGLTEYWRAFRKFAGILHFVYLSNDTPQAFTADNFEDVTTLEFQPAFKKYVAEAFKPLGVYLHFWKRELPPGEERDFQVMMINDHARNIGGLLSLVVADADGKEARRTDRPLPFEIAGNGQQTYFVAFQAPQEPGAYLLKAIASYREGPRVEQTISRRWITIAHAPSKPTREKGNLN